MKGRDILVWQNEVKDQFRRMAIDCPIVIDGVYSVATRSFTASLCHALGMSEKRVMADGVTPELRTRIRERRLTDAEKKAMDGRKEYRQALRRRWKRAASRVHTPTLRILADSWGYHPPIHDGLDIITPPDALIFAMVKSKVIDVRSSGWWGKGSPSNPALKAKGDGIIQLEILETVGPFIKGHHIGYGHAEKAQVRKGQVVQAGTVLGRAGLANAWHIHLMYNDGSTTKGVGNKDPRPILNYAVRNG
jgi:hypothetical protein